MKLSVKEKASYGLGAVGKDMSVPLIKEHVIWAPYLNRMFKMYIKTHQRESVSILVTSELFHLSETTIIIPYVVVVCSLS